MDFRASGPHANTSAKPHDPGLKGQIHKVMISKAVKTLGLQINVDVPSSVEEYDSMAKQVGACLESGVANTIYRGYLAEFRSTFSDKLAEKSGIARATKPSGKFVKDEAGKDTEEAILVYSETESDHFDRVLVETKTEKSAWQELALEVASGIKFDPSAAERAPAGPKKTSAKFIKAATDLIAAGKGDAVAAFLTTKLGFAVEPNIESLGRAIAEDQKRKAAELANQY